MNLDDLTARHDDDWQRLAALAKRASSRAGGLTGAEVDELTSLYLLTSSHLAWLRTHHPHLQLVTSLTSTVGMANGAIYGARRGAWRSCMTFFSTTFPAAVWFHRVRIVIAAVALLGPAFIIGAWLATSDAAIEATADEITRAAYVDSDFESYYSSQPAEQFSAEVFFNNVQVAFYAFAAGITLGLGTLFVLIFNGANAGLAGGLFHHAGQADVFWGLILPHGLLELSAIIVAGAAGLGLGWSIVAPGDQLRTTSLAEEGGRSVTIVLGLIPAFGLAALIEAFITPSGLGTPSRIAVGVLAATGFWIWVLSIGRHAAAHGHTGRLNQA
jgi:uncharacterized membrane protein SpoIIM required for sporulation